MTKTDTRNLMLVSLTSLTLAVLSSTTGCVMPPKDVTDDDVGNPLPPVNPVGPASPDVESEDPTEEEPEPSIQLLFGGPPAGTVVDAGAADDAEVLCFNITSSHDVEIHKIRLRFEALSATDYIGGRLVNNVDNTANYTDIKFVSVTSGQVFFGPTDLLGTGNDQEQSIFLNDVQGLGADETLELCVQIDVRSGLNAMNGDEIRVSLLPFGQGDIRFIDGTDFPVDSIDPADSLSTTFVINVVEEEPYNDSCELPSETDIDHALPMVSLASLPTTTLVNGTSTIARITLTADSDSGDLEIHQLALSIVSDASLFAVDVREIGTGINLTETTTAMPGYIFHEALVWLTLDTPFVVVAGTSRTLEFRAILSNVVSGKSISTQLLLDDEAVSTCEMSDHDGRVLLEDEASYLIWSTSDLEGFHNGAEVIQPDEQFLFAL